MAKHIYMTLAALLVLVIAVSAAPAKMDYDVAKDSDFPVSRKAAAVQSSSAESDEAQEDDDEGEVKKQQSDSDENDDDDEEDDDDDDDEESLIRRRREAAEEPAKETAAETETAAEPEAAAAEPAEATTVPSASASASAVPTTRKPVLVLIRDALKKVTTGLPTEQVATNALQYFQLFEHFIQQTIEQVIDAADDNEDEAPATVLPSTAEEDKKPEEATVDAKPTEEAEVAAPAAAETPVETPAEAVEQKPVEPAASVASNSV